jgi:hypothetical protein
MWYDGRMEERPKVKPIKVWGQVFPLAEVRRMAASIGRIIQPGLTEKLENLSQIQEEILRHAGP